MNFKQHKNEIIASFKYSMPYAIRILDLLGLIFDFISV